MYLTKSVGYISVTSDHDYAVWDQLNIQIRHRSSQFWKGWSVIDMRYLIITYDDYFNIPYIKYYEDQFRRHGNPYDIIIWNRSGQNTEDIPNACVFRAKESSSKLGKILPFLRWRRFVLDQLKRHNYDRLIVLTTIPGILLADKLLGQYRGRYWFDIRDYTYEYIPLYKYLVGKLTNAAAIASISSEAFHTFLPEDVPLVLTHNITNLDAEESRCRLDPQKQMLTIGFVGGIQYAQQNKLLLRHFGNDGHYQLKYVGKVHPSCDLESYCQENDIYNVEFLPAYRNEEKPEIYRSIDLINSIYGGNSKIVQLALPNKLYDCILFKKPILVSKGTYLASVVEQYHLGLAVDLEADAVKQLVNCYLADFNPQLFEEGCRMFLEKVNSENKLYYQALECFCSGRESE